MFENLRMDFLQKHEEKKLLKIQNKKISADKTSDFELCSKMKEIDLSYVVVGAAI